MDSRRPRTVAVVGAGVAGLVAARHLAREGAGVVVWEAGDRLGGQVETIEPVPGVHLDVGAEALHLAAPGVAALVEELGLADRMVTAPPGSSRLLTRRGTRPLPAGVGPAGPTRLGPVLASRTMTWPGLARAGLEPVTARWGRPLADGADVSVGDFVSRRFGRQVTGTFVDPLLGNLHAGDVGRLSLRACAPALVPAATGRRSLVLRRRGRGSPPALSFVTWPGGLAEVTSRLVADQSRVEVRLAEPVSRLEQAGAGFDVVTARGRHHVDAVVLAVPARVAAGVLADLAPAAATTLAGIGTADVATVLLGVPRRQAAALPGTGLLVPSATGRLLKAATHLGHKWPHLADADDFWVRLSAGRAGDTRLAALTDDALVAALLRDLRETTGAVLDPTATVVRRWPGALPQLTVGHLDRMAAARADLPAGVVLAGASYDGLGLAACIRSGRTAATALTIPEEAR